MSTRQPAPLPDCLIAEAGPPRLHVLPFEKGSNPMVSIAGASFVIGFLIGRSGRAVTPSAPRTQATTATLVNPDVMDRVNTYLAAGQKIQAIKAYREAFPGASLREAKDAIEAMASHQPERS